MRSSRMTLAMTAVTVAALGIGVTACGSSSKTAADVTTTTAKPAPAPLTITAGDYSYSGVPATIPAGIVSVKFVNGGTVDHEMAFIKVTDNSDPQTVFKGLGTVLQGGPFPTTFLAANGVPNTPAGKTTNTQFNLTPGQYVALCTDTGVVGSTKDGKPHFERGMYKAVTVTGTGGNVAPTSTSSITAHDYGFALSGIKAGSQTVVFKNVGPVQWHFSEILEFAKGTTVTQAQADVGKLLASNGPPPPGVAAPTDVATSQIASPGYGNTFSATFESGRTYVVLCFVSDKKGGPPHAIAHHMYKVFSVS
jgi:hypothetical protein